MWPDLQTRYAAAVIDPALPVPAGIDGEHGRFDVYRNNVMVSLTDALADTYPVTASLVGDEFFAAMAGVYIRQDLPAAPMLMQYGDKFADFIDGFEPADAVPFLADVARLERAWLDAYHAVDATSVAIGVLATLGDDDIQQARLILHPSLQVVGSTFPVVSIWQAHQDTCTPDLGDISPSSEYALIVRPEMDVVVMTIDAAAADFIAAIQMGQSLAAALETLAEHADADQSFHLNNLFAAGCIIGLEI